MWLILDDCFVCDEMEPGLLTGLMQPSRLHLTNSTSTSSLLWKTSGKAAERRNSFLRCEVFTGCPVCSMAWRWEEFSFWEHLMLAGPRSVSADRRLRAFTQEKLWKSSWAGSRNRENCWWSSATRLLPFLRKLGNTPCLECIQNSQILKTSQTSCSMDTRIRFSKSQWLAPLLSL